MRYEFVGLIFGAAYTWRGVFSEFYGTNFIQDVNKLIYRKNIVVTNLVPRVLSYPPSLAPWGG